MSWIDWESETYPSNEDLLMVPVFGLFFPLVRFFLDRFIFERLARRFVPGSAKGASQDEQDECKKRHIKFKESAWKCIYYLSAEIIALAVTYNEPWFTNTGNFWVGPGAQVWPDQKVKTKLKALYMYTAGFYTYGIFALMFWETRRSDFGVSMGHHVATVILIILSYFLSYEVVHTLDKKKHQKEGPIYYYVFNTLLYCLLVLHIYWWVLMYRMLVKQIKARGKLGEDVRSDSEDEDDKRD